MKELKYQVKAVNELVEKVIRLLNTSGNRKKLVFEAPTGAGKTVMASDMLSRFEGRNAVDIEELLKEYISRKAWEH